MAGNHNLLIILANLLIIFLQKLWETFFYLKVDVL